jgi:hypothetical protein
VAAYPRPPGWVVEDTEFNGDAECEGILKGKIAAYIADFA